MAKNRAPEKGKIGFFSIIIISLIFSASVCALVYLPLGSFIKSNSSEPTNLITVFLLLIGISLTVIFIFVGILLNRVTIERTYIRELKNFKDFTDSLHRVSSEKEVYEIMYNFICKIAQVSNITLFYRSDRPSEDNLWQRMGYEKVPLCNMSPKNCPVIRTGRECRITSIQNGITCAYQLPDYKIGSYLCLIIVEIGYPQSILQLYSKNENAFNDAIVSKIKSYTEIAKMVINSKRTLNTLDKKASTDKLTKLYNRSYLDSYLDDQIEISSRTKELLSVIMLDIDHFKRINDTYGHSAGDHVLALFAQLILKCTRVSDLVARYGGEEFLVVLPSTNIETAQGIAERIRQTVAEAYMPPLDGVNLPSITCSLGVSTFPIYSDSKDTLIKSADIALYKAKQSGRNRTIIYEKSLGPIDESTIKSKK